MGEDKRQLLVKHAAGASPESCTSDQWFAP